jgi:acid phosphatase type 7
MRTASVAALATLATAMPPPGSAALASNDTIPMQHRLAYAGDTGMHVSWNTYSPLSKPIVRYGTNPYALNMEASSNVSVTYQTSTTYNNHVKITGLKPDTLYYYQPIHDNSTTPYTFKTSKAAGDGSSMTVAVVVDLGTMGADGLTTHIGVGAANPLKPGVVNTIQALGNAKSSYDFVWHPGDIAYADYWLKEEIQKFLPNTTLAGGAAVYERILNEFYDQMTVVTSERPYMTGPGNYEANCDNGGTTDPSTNTNYTVSICMPGQTNFTGYINHFRMPSDHSGGTGNFWYSFDHGMAHFIQLDTETDLGHGFIAPDEPGGPEKENSGPFNPIMNAQTTWLANDLAAVDRSKTPWVIVAGHRPWYISYANKSSAVCTVCKDVFEPIFLQYDVDLVLSGHVHAYQRNAPIYNYVADENDLSNPKFPWYITNGAAGHYDGLDTLQRPFTNYTRYAADSVYGWSKLSFHNCTHLTHDFVASGNGSVLDTATLYKERTCMFNR